MNDADLNQDFRDMLEALVHEQVEFLIVGAAGGWADGLARPLRGNLNSLQHSHEA